MPCGWLPARPAQLNRPAARRSGRERAGRRARVVARRPSVRRVSSYSVGPKKSQPFRRRRGRDPGRPSREPLSDPLQLREGKGLLQVGVKASIPRPNICGFIAKCRHGNKAGMGTLGDAAHATRNLVPVHFGHPQVAEHEVRAVLTNLLKPLLAVFGHVHPGTEMGQQRPRKFAMIGMVFNDQNGHAFQGHGHATPSNTPVTDMVAVRERSARQSGRCHRHRRSVRALRSTVRPRSMLRCHPYLPRFHRGIPGLGGLWSTYEPERCWAARRATL